VKAQDAALARWWPWWGSYQRQLDRDTPLEPKHVRDGFVAGYFAGAAYALKTSSELAGLLPVLDLFNQLLAAELIQQADQDVMSTKGGEALS